MHTHRVARLVAILLFLAALVYFCGGMAVGLPLWSRGLGEGWGSGFSGWLAIPILAGTVFGAIVLLVFGAILYFLARIDTNLATAQQKPPVSTVEPAEVVAVAGGATVAGEPPPIVPPEAAPVPVEPIVVGAAAAATLAAASDEAPPSAAEVETHASAEPAKAGLGAAATAAVAGAVVAGVAVVAAHKDETATEAETNAAPETAEAGVGEVASAAAAGVAVAGVAAAVAHEDEATPAKTEAASEAAVAAGPQVEIGPPEPPVFEGEPPSPELGVPAAVTAVAGAAVVAATEQTPPPVVESSEAVAAPPVSAASEVAAVAAPKLSGLDAFLVGLGRLAIGQKPDQPAETPAPVSGKSEAKSAPAATPPPDLQAELPAVEDAAPQEFTGKLPGADEAARIASEMSGGDPGKPAATE